MPVCPTLDHAAEGRALPGGRVAVRPGVFRVEVGQMGIRRIVPCEEMDSITPLAAEDPRRVWIEELSNGLETWKTPLRAPLEIVGTPFQRLVWEFLRTIPVGETRTYAAVARSIGMPRAARAVARACAANELAIAIPCHRVVPASGGPGGYRWGRELKQKILEFEQVLISESG